MNERLDGKERSVLTSFLSNLPEDVVSSFTPEQRAALWNAANPISWRKHAVDIRLSIPLPGRRYFATLVLGRERRSTERLERERGRHPVLTVDNLIFLVSTGGCLVLVTAVILYLLSRLIVF